MFFSVKDAVWPSEAQPAAGALPPTSLRDRVHTTQWPEPHILHVFCKYIQGQRTGQQSVWHLAGAEQALPAFLPDILSLVARACLHQCGISNTVPGR